LLIGFESKAWRNRRQKGILGRAKVETHAAQASPRACPPGEATIEGSASARKKSASR